MWAPDRAGLRPRFAASTGGGREVWTLSCPRGWAGWRPVPPLSPVPSPRSARSGAVRFLSPLRGGGGCGREAWAWGSGSGRFASPLRGFNRWWSRSVEAFLPLGGPAGARCRALVGAPWRRRRRAGPGAAAPRSRPTRSAAVRFLSPLRGGAGCGREAWACGVRIGLVCVPASRLQQVVVARCGRFLPWAARRPPPVADADAGGAVRGPRPRTAWTWPGAAGGSRPHLARGPAGRRPGLGTSARHWIPPSSTRPRAPGSRRRRR